MKGRNFNIPPVRPRVLIAPLDWGLGHATRCIPIIFKLIKENCDVIIAAEGAGKALLQKEFIQLEFIELRGYRVSYSRTGALMPLKMLLQFPRVLYSIYAEHRWLKKVVEANKIDAVISDNRLGLFHFKIPCIYITHQLKIKTGNTFTESIAQKIHYHFINKYNACWVPDMRTGDNLAGELSHPAKLPETPVEYIGTLSRFEKQEALHKYELCIILSGPEPQRTIFEKIILKGLDQIAGNVFLLRGLPNNSQPIKVGAHVQIRDHLPAAELNRVILQSKLVLSRCGYSSIMDLAKLQKKGLLVPTPGQTEQEYLAGYLKAKGLFYCVAQNELVLDKAIKEAGDHDYPIMNIDETGLEKEIGLLVKQLFQINNGGI